MIVTRRLVIVAATFKPFIGDGNISQPSPRMGTESRVLVAFSHLPYDGCHLSIAGCQLSIAGYRLPAAGSRLPAAGCRLPVFLFFHTICPMPKPRVIILADVHRPGVAKPL